MKIKVNLLPTAFVVRRRRHRRTRAWIGVCVLLALLQSAAALYVYNSARDVRQFRERQDQLAVAFKQGKADLESLRSKRDIMTRDVELARRLREKHMWSRWLGNLSVMTPQRVTMTNVQTEPAVFADSMLFTQQSVRGAASSPISAGVRTMRLNGRVSQHEDLIELLKALNGMKTFRSVRLEEAKREKLSDRETIGFSVACDW